MKKNDIYLMYIQRVIHASENNFKTKEEIFNSLDPKIDQQDFDKYFNDLKSKGRLEEHLTTGKWKLSTAADTGMILLNREENQERLRMDFPIHNPNKNITIPNIKKIASSLWKFINFNIISQLLSVGILSLIGYIIKRLLS